MNALVARVATGLALASLLFLSPAAAQDGPAPFLQVFEVRVAPGQGAAFERSVVEIAEAFRKTDSTPHWAMFEVRMGGPGRTYTVALGFDAWGDVDAWKRVPEVVAAAFGEKAAEPILAAWSGAIESSTSRVYALLEDLSRPPAGAVPAAHYLIVDTEVVPARAEDYELYLAKINEAAREVPGAPALIRRRSTLGPSFHYVTALPMRTLGERDGWPGGPRANLEKVYGKEEARRLTAMARRATASRTVSVISFRPDLSWLGTAAPTSE